MKNFFTGKVIKVEETEEVEKQTKLSPFDIIKNINTKKEKLTIDDLNQSYLPFIINKAFSQAKETIYFADELNLAFKGLPDDLVKRMSYDFYYHLLPKSQKYNKWQKKDTENSEILELIQEVYQYSPKKAKDVLSLFLDKKQYLKTLVDTGGRIK